MTIDFNGKQINVEQVLPGVVKKTDTIYYIQDSVSGKWLYCSAARFEKLNASLKGDFSKYVGKDSQRASKRSTS
jgi:hypothetical protein